MGPSNSYVTVNGKDVLRFFRILALLLSMLYVAVYIAYVVQVVMRTRFLYGYYRMDLKPGPLIDDRFSWPWWFLMLNNLRIFASPGLIWIFQNASMRIKSVLVGWAFGILILIDIVLIVTWYVAGGFFCNDGVFRDGLCDAPRDQYCQAWWTNQTDWCDPSPIPPTLDGSSLPKNVMYWPLVNYTWGFLLLDIALATYVLVTRVLAPRTVNAHPGAAQIPYPAEAPKPSP
jgi:hypothetical protein